MKKLLLIALVPFYANAHDGMDEPLQISVDVPKLEVFQAQNEHQSAYRWDGHIALGDDINKLQLRYKGERAEGDIRESALIVLGQRAVAPYWDFTYGLAKQRWMPSTPQFDIGEARTQAVLGLEGLAPYFVDVSTQVFMGKQGQLRWTLDIEKEWLITRRLGLSPFVEVLASRKADTSNNLDAGINRVEWGAALRYQLARELTPYLALRREDWFGQAPLATSKNLTRKDETVAVLGLSFWY